MHMGVYHLYMLLLIQYNVSSLQKSFSDLLEWKKEEKKAKISFIYLVKCPLCHDHQWKFILMVKVCALVFGVLCSKLSDKYNINHFVNLSYHHFNTFVTPIPALLPAHRRCKMPFTYLCWNISSPASVLNVCCSECAH